MYVCDDNERRRAHVNGLTLHRESRSGLGVQMIPPSESQKRHLQPFSLHAEMSYFDADAAALNCRSREVETTSAVMDADLLT